MTFGPLRRSQGIPVVSDFDGPEPPLVVDGVTGALYSITDGDVVVRVGGNIVYYAPASLTKNTGGTPVGTLAGVLALADGSEYVCPEVTGVPGFDIEFAWAGITTPPTMILLRAWYEGSISHDVHVEIYNYVTPGWDRIHVIADKEDYELIVLPLPSFTPYLSAGAAKVRIYHDTSGNASHTMRVEYVALRS